MKNNTAQKFAAHELVELDAFLKSQTSNMSLVKAHGFITAVVSFPDLIVPSEWLPILIGKFKMPHERNHTKLMLSILISMYKQIADSLSSNYQFDFLLSAEQPILSLENAPYNAIQEWCSGYCLALVWNEDEWLNTKEDFITQACATFFMLTDLIRTEKQQLDTLAWKRDKQKLLKNLPDLIKGLYTYWQDKENDVLEFRPLPPSYTHEACPCGSKKSYTNCCLLEVTEAVLH